MGTGGYPFNTMLDKIPESLDDVKQFDNFGFQDVVGAWLHVYPIKKIDGIFYMAMESTDSKTIGEVKQEDKDMIANVG